MTGTALRALAALLLGTALGVAAASTGLTALLRLSAWLEPLGTLWVNAIRMTVIPLIVASLLVAVSAAGARTVGRLGTRAFVVFVLLLAGVAGLSALLAPPIFARLAIDPAAAASVRAAATPVAAPELPSFASWVVGLVPANPVRAAADGAMLPLLVFTLAFGLALGRLAPERRRPVVAFFQGVAEATTTLVGWILALAPIGVFALALPLATRLGTGVIGAAGFYLLAHAALLVVPLVLLYAVAALAGRMPPARFARAALPAQVVAVTTRSSMAALPAMLAAAEGPLRLPRTVTSFGLPLAVATLRLNQGASWLAMALFAARLYGVELGAAEIATLAVTSVLLSFSVPGIPSGSLFVVTPFFVAAGIPPEAVGVLIALDLVPDVFKTLLNVTGHLTAVSVLGRMDEGRPADRVAGDGASPRREPLGREGSV